MINTILVVLVQKEPTQDITKGGLKAMKFPKIHGVLCSGALSQKYGHAPCAFQNSLTKEKFTLTLEHRSLEKRGIKCWICYHN